ncbi:type III polyketide synthase [Streptomyces sp. NPDC020681]|uniref:type III polyketide synthase n=1 Tax=Streptomyces sp. NPDC020681 TaxID=3365083 RepID=UPI0037B0E306
MPTLCRPFVWVPEYTISMNETLDMCRRLHADHEKLPLILRMVEDTGIRERHLIQPIEQTLQHPGVEARKRIYLSEARAHVPSVIQQALASADVAAEDIDAIAFVSCSEFNMPPLTASMINAMGFRKDARQIPIAQLGCAAGGAAINRAHDFCIAYPDTNVLIVACEFCSLCYQPMDMGVGSVLSNGLLGDAIAAAVMRGAGGMGLKLERNASYLIPYTENWMPDEAVATSFDFQAERRVPGTISLLAPSLHMLASSHGWNASKLDFYVIHAGGPGILDGLSRFLAVEPDAFRHSRATLTEYGNIASAVVLDALRRLFDEGLPEGVRGLVAGFGPGITAEASLGTWVTESFAPTPGRNRASGDS